MLSRCVFIALASSFAQIIGETSGHAPEITASCSDTQGKEAKSVSAGHSKRWESRVFSKD